MTFFDDPAEFPFPLLFRPIGRPVAECTERDQVSWVVILLVVINVVNVEGSNLLRASSALLALIVIALADARSEGGAKFFRVSHVKTLATLAEVYRYTVLAIHAVVAAFYEALGFGYWFSAPGARNRNSIVVPVFVPSRSFVLPSVIAGTSCSAKHTQALVPVPFGSGYWFTALLTRYQLYSVGLNSTPMTVDKLPSPAARIVFIKQFSAATRTLDHNAIFHGGIIT